MGQPARGNNEDFDRTVFKKWLAYREAVESDTAAALLVLTEYVSKI